MTDQRFGGGGGNGHNNPPDNPNFTNYDMPTVNCLMTT